MAEWAFDDAADLDVAVRPSGEEFEDCVDDFADRT